MCLKRAGEPEAKYLIFPFAAKRENFQNLDKFYDVRDGCIKTNWALAGLAH